MDVSTSIKSGPHKPCGCSGSPQLQKPHSGAGGQSFHKAQTWACLSILPPAFPHGAHLSLSVSMGTLFFSHMIRGLGSPWIWHWKRATPPSSPATAWGCTWKSDMAGERQGDVCGRGTLLRSREQGGVVTGTQASVLGPWRSSHPGAGVVRALADTRHQPGGTRRHFPSLPSWEMFSPKGLYRLGWHI